MINTYVMPNAIFISNEGMCFLIKYLKVGNTNFEKKNSLAISYIQVDQKNVTQIHHKICIQCEQIYIFFSSQK